MSVQPQPLVEAGTIESPLPAENRSTFLFLELLRKWNTICDN